MVPQIALRETFGQRIDRQHLPVRRRLVRVDPLHARMVHFPPPATQRRFARHENLLAARELFGHIRLIEPHGTEVITPFAHEHAQHRSPRAAAP